jgi:pilus assembly protein FimV
MNRLRSGVVLSVPSADLTGSIAPSEARELIQAQSADFGAYRQKLAGVVPEAKGEASSRQAGGKVQAEVEDRKQAAATTPDKLTLSKGSTAGKASAPEEKISKEREKKDTATRVAELSKNVEELKKLAGAASVPAAKSPAAAVAPASAPAGLKAPITVKAPIAVAPPAPPLTVAKPASAPTPAPAPAASAPAPAPVVASAVAPAMVAKPSVTASAAEPRPVATARPASAAVAARPPAAPVEEPSALSAMFDENPWALGVGAAIVALLVGLGIYRFARRSKKESGETSFLESRLQPDSFFGASGGQRIDTRDAGGASSSMSYSLSQLDAIGDVDPVAEADVYLAYGRDLQAEEILKEAMRSSPERLAIRTKLLEVYAKRRDTKGFELLATQLFALTRGEGEDWAKAQELGQQIDPDNTLYKPGGAPVTVGGQSKPSTEPLGASTMPQSVLPSPSQFEQANAELEHRAAVDSGNVDLDLDLGTPAGPISPPAPMIRTQPLPPRAPEPRQAPSSFDFSAMPDLPPAPSPAAPAPAHNAEFPMDFDLSSISLDLDAPMAAQEPARATEHDADLSAIDFAPGAGDGGDPLARKLELAEEFRQIGDMEGARDLLQEVVAKASGALKSKAQGMLNELA